MGILEPTTKIIIIGSGLSGVALAQILRKEGVDFEIFERDGGTRSQGWTIGLDECLKDLSRLLPTDLPDLATSRPNFGRDEIDSFAIMDGLSHELLGVTSTKRFGDKVPSLFAHRLKLRDILKTHLDVRHSKHFVRYEQDADGVTAYFKDGTSTRGSLLIGADGANSSVRTQLLQGFKAAPSQYLTALGKVVLPKEHYAPLLEHSTAGPLAAGPDDKTYCLLMEYLEDGRAVFNWNVSWRSKNLEEDYQKMVASGPEAQLEMVKQRLEKWPPAMRKAIGQTKVGDLQWPPVRLMETVLPPHGLPRGRVTLVGDAAHSMVPFRGMGANSALLDACNLGEGLLRGIEAREDLQWVLQKYEEVMIPRGRQRVLEARETGNSTDASQIAGGRLPDAQTHASSLPT